MDKQEYTVRVAWLRRYQESLRERRLLEEMLEQRQAEAERIGPLLQYLPGGASVGNATSADKLPRAVERIIDTEKELDAQIAYCDIVCQQVRKTIASEPNARLREILTRRYILGQSFADIAQKMNLHERWVYRLHRESISHLVMNFASKSQ